MKAAGDDHSVSRSPGEISYQVEGLNFLNSYSKFSIS